MSRVSKICRLEFQLAAKRYPSVLEANPTFSQAYDADKHSIPMNTTQPECCHVYPINAFLSSALNVALFVCWREFIFGEKRAAVGNQQKPSVENEKWSILFFIAI